MRSSSLKQLELFDIGCDIDPYNIFALWHKLRYDDKTRALFKENPRQLLTSYGLGEEVIHRISTEVILEDQRLTQHSRQYLTLDIKPLQGYIIEPAQGVWFHVFVIVAEVVIAVATSVVFVGC